MWAWAPLMFHPLFSHVCRTLFTQQMIWKTFYEDMNVLNEDRAQWLISQEWKQQRNQTMKYHSEAKLRNVKCLLMLETPAQFSSEHLWGFWQEKVPEAQSLCEIWTMNYPKEIINKGHMMWCSNRERDNSPLSCVIYLSGGVVKTLSKYAAHCVFGWRTHICFRPVKLEVFA